MIRWHECPIDKVDVCDDATGPILIRGVWDRREEFLYMRMCRSLGVWVSTDWTVESRPCSSDSGDDGMVPEDTCR